MRIIITPSWENEKSMKLRAQGGGRAQVMSSCLDRTAELLRAWALGPACLGSRSAMPLSCSETFASPGHFISLFLHFLTCKMEIFIGSLGGRRKGGSEFMVLPVVVSRIKSGNICNRLNSAWHMLYKC